MSNYMLDFITTLIVILGAFNWGMIGISSTNAIERIFGASLARIIYILIGFAGLIQLIILASHKQGLKYLA